MSDGSERPTPGADLVKYAEDETIVVDMNDSTVCEGEWWFDGLDDLESMISDLEDIRDTVRQLHTGTERSGQSENRSQTEGN